MAVHLEAVRREQTVEKLVATIASLALSSLLLALIARTAVSVPFQDELTFDRLFAALAANQAPSAVELLAAHNGHPYILLKLLISVTLKLNLPWTWMMYAQVPLLLVSFLIALSRVSFWSRFNGLLAAGALALLLLTPRQWENLYWSMQLAFPIFLTSSLAAFALTSRFAAENSLGHLLGAVLFSLIATISNGAGILSLLLTSGALLLFLRKKTHLLIVLSSTLLGVAAFIASQALAPRSGVGVGTLPLVAAVEHALRMFSHAYSDFEGKRVFSIATGCVTFAIAIYCLWRAMREWPSTVFEILCVVLGSSLVLGVTYSRVSAGIFQPDAPRYLPLVAPVAIGCVLLLNRWGKTLLLCAAVALLLFGYLTSLKSEWLLSAARRANMIEAKAWLCIDGALHPAHNMKIVLSPTAIRNLQSLFCGNEKLAVVDHASIATSSSDGYYREESQTWIRPRFSTLIPNPEVDELILTGWVPDVSSYPDSKLRMQVLFDDLPVQSFDVHDAGQFSKIILVPRGSRSVVIVASRRDKVGADERDLSWLLVNLQFRRASSGN